MTYRKQFWFVLLLLMVSFTVQALPPGLSSLEKAFVQSTDQNSGPITPPNPLDLQPGWTHYFEPRANLANAVASFLQQVNDQVAELPQESKGSLQPALTLLRTNLTLLPKAAAQQTAELAPNTQLKNRYTLDDLMTLIEQQQTVQAELQAEREDIRAAQQTLEQANQKIDRLMVSYLQLPSGSFQKLRQGLDIIALYSDYAVTRQGLRLQRQEQKINQKRLQQIDETQQEAITRLHVSNEQMQATEEAIAKWQNIVSEREANMLRARTRAMSIFGEGDFDRAQLRLLQQKSLQQSTQYMVAKVQLLQFSVQQLLEKLLLQQESLQTDALFTALYAWRKQLDKDQTDINTWITLSKKERNRVSDALASNNQDDASLQKINQQRLKLAQNTLLDLQRLTDELKKTVYILDLTETELTDKSAGLTVWWSRFLALFANFQLTANEWLHGSLFKIGDAPVTIAGLLQISFILFIAWLVSKIWRRALRRLNRGDQQQAALYTVDRVSHYLIIIIGVLFGLTSVGLDLTNIALVAGAMAIGIGFGLQSMVNNFVSGLILLFERSMKVGDFVELTSGTAGEVKDIKVRSTIINTNDNLDIVVPNSQFINNNVINWTLSQGYCRIHLPFHVAYGTDKERVRQAGLEAADRLPHTLNGIPGRNPGVWLVKFGDSALHFELVVWVTPRAVKRPGAVHAAYMWEIESALRANNIEIPCPKREIYMHQKPYSVWEDASKENDS